MAEMVRLLANRSEPPLPIVSTAANESNPEHTVATAAITVAEFVERMFLPQHVMNKGTPGRRHYQAILKHILHPDRVDKMFKIQPERSKVKLRSLEWPYLDQIPLQRINAEHVQKLMSIALRSGYSTQTVKHIRSAISAIISHAIKSGDFIGVNPAIQVILPGMQRKPPHVLTFVQTVAVLQAMRYPEWEITILAILTGMTIAEICGLQWKYVNLSSYVVHREDETIPPVSIAIRKQWYRGELSSVPKARKKNVPIPILFKPVFSQLSQSISAGWNDFVLVSKSGRPINQINIAARRLKMIGKQLNLPWLSWQVLRRTRAQLLSEFGAQLQYELAAAVTMKFGFRSGTGRRGFTR